MDKFTQFLHFQQTNLTILLLFSGIRYSSCVGAYTGLRIIQQVILTSFEISVHYLFNSVNDSIESTKVVVVVVVVVPVCLYRGEK